MKRDDHQATADRHRRRITSTRTIFISRATSTVTVPLLVADEDRYIPQPCGPTLQQLEEQLTQRGKIKAVSSRSIAAVQAFNDIVGKQPPSCAIR
jgi:hypothetical protein